MRCRRNAIHWASLLNLVAGQYLKYRFRTPTSVEEHKKYLCYAIFSLTDDCQNTDIVISLSNFLLKFYCMKTFAIAIRQAPGSPGISCGSKRKQFLNILFHFHMGTVQVESSIQALSFRFCLFVSELKLK